MAYQAPTEPREETHRKNARYRIATLAFPALPQTGKSLVFRSRRASWLSSALHTNTGTLLTGHSLPGNRKFLVRWPYPDCDPDYKHGGTERCGCP